MTYRINRSSSLYSDIEAPRSFEDFNDKISTDNCILFRISILFFIVGWWCGIYWFALTWLKVHETSPIRILLYTFELFK